MQMRNLLAVAFLGTCCIISDASYAAIAGYKPGSKVTSHNAIDLDQKALELALAQSTIDYTLVKNIYSQGGNSKTYAEFTVPPLTTALSKGDAVRGKTSGATGKLYASFAKMMTTIKVAYSTSDTQASYVSCKGGALMAPPAGTTATAMTPYILTTGCFQNEVLEVTTTDDAGESVTVEITPSGPPTNKAGRTLQGFSTKAKLLMYTKPAEGGCGKRDTDGCPYEEYTKYYDFYGDGAYADKLVLAAIDGGYTSFTKSAGQMDFKDTPDKLRKEIIKKGTAYMNAYMYAIREFEDAIDDCNAGCPGGQTDKVDGKDCNKLSIDAVHAWDEGVAFYTGSLEGTAAGGNSDGKLSYRLAEKRCGNFKTCGENGDSLTGTSQVNIELFKQLDIGQNHLLKGECEATRPVVQKMVALMSVPLIQGTLRYAYKVDKLSGDEKAKGEGAIFAAAIMPRVAACSATDAATIMDHMKIGGVETSFAGVKAAFENNYACMGITCAHVGGLWFESESKYYEGAEPCGTNNEVSQCAPHPGVFTAANLIILLAAVFCFSR